MKTIEVSDEDYETLMTLSKELQLQPNDGNAFPYFWEPGHELLETNFNDEGEECFIYDCSDAESYSPKEYADHKYGLWVEYLRDIGSYEIEDGEVRSYQKDDENKWIAYIEEYGKGVRVYTQDWVHKTTHNPSLFKDDVKEFIEGNQHHLGRNPHTYARTSFRMYRMGKLIEALYRLNKQPIEDVNHEARRFVYPK